jgi:thioredoxin-related protein
MIRNMTPVLVVVLLLALAGCDGRAWNGADVRPPADSLTPADPQASEDHWAEHKQGLPFVLGYEQGLEQAKASGKPALVFVTATWCGWCKKLADDNFNHPEIRPLLDQFTLVIVDGDAQRDVVQRLQVAGFPHLVLQSSTGNVLAQVRGYVPPEALQPTLERALQLAQDKS